MLLIDRLLLRSFFKAWLTCFACLVSLYVVIDLFNKLDEFVDAAQKTGLSLVETLATYYAFQSILIFDRLCNVIVMLAATFTIAWMQRNNELLPLLSAGVPTRRVLHPVFLGTLVVVGLSVANRELLLPQVNERITRPASDPEGDEALSVHGTYERNGTLISGQAAFRKERLVTNFSCTIQEHVVGSLFHVTAREARYVPPGDGPHTGGWLMTDTTPSQIDPHLRQAGLEMIDPGKFFLRVERVDFDLLTRGRGWCQFASTWEIFQELQEPDSARMAAMAVQLHLRLTVPLLTLLMVVMGLGMILRDHARNTFINASLCLVLAGVFYGVCFVTRHLGEQEYVAPALAAWLPIMLFGPITFALFDAMHT